MTDTALVENAQQLIEELPPLMPSPHALRLLSSNAVAAADPTADPAAVTPPAGAVVGNTLTSFTAGLDAGYATALQYAVGFCQLQVTQNQGKDPNVDPIGYYQAVTAMLQRIGLVNQGLTWSSFSTQTKTVSIDQVVVKILEGLLTGPQLSTAIATLDALKASADDNGAPWQIFSSHSQSNNNGAFSLGAANQTAGPDGSPQVAMELSAFRLTGTEQNSRFLWASYSSTSLAIQYGKTQLAFNLDLWNRPGVGDSVSRAMGAAAAGYIAGLPPLKLT